MCNETNASSKGRKSFAEKYLNNKYLKATTVIIFSCCSVMFFTSIVYFLYNIMSRNNQLSEIALALYTENPDGALSILQETTSISTEFMTIIISIFAIVVTVWVGLNIYNVLSRDELNVLSDQISNASEKVQQVSHDVQQSNEEQKDMANDIAGKSKQIADLVERSTHRIYFDLQAFIKSSELEYTAINYVDYCFEDLVEEDDYRLIDKLIRIELFYSSAMKSYYGDNPSSCRDAANKSYDICKDLIDSQEYRHNKVLMGFLCVRAANLKYFISLTKESGALAECVVYAELALKYWFPMLPNVEQYHIEQRYSLMDIYNLIALSTHYIYISEDDTSERGTKLEEQMRKYYDKLKILLRDNHVDGTYPKRYALYMRNIGTSKDFIYHHDKTKQISEDSVACYKKAIGAYPKEKKAYRNIVSFRIKQFKFGYMNKESPQKRQQYLNEMIQYATIFKNVAPYSIEAYSFLGSCYALNYLETKNNSSLNLYCENINLAISYLQVKEKDELRQRLNKSQDEEIRVYDILECKSHRFNRAIENNLQEIKEAIALLKQI